MSTVQGIKLDDETKSRLKALAQKRDRSPHWLMKRAIGEYLDRAERYEAEKIEDMARWEAYVQSGQAIDSKEVVDWLTDLSAGKVRPRPQ